MVLLVKTVVKKSSIQGVGLFADEDIKKGTVVWTFMEDIDRKYSHDEVQQMAPTVRNFLDTYSYLSVTTRTHVLSGDNDRFINHSDEPNVILHHTERLGEKDDIAARDIQKGEELTCNYFLFDMLAGAKLPMPRPAPRLRESY